MHRYERGVPNLAKVGVEGWNPFARSNFLPANQRLRRILRGPLLLPRLWDGSRGSRQKRNVAGSRSPPACLASIRQQEVPGQNRVSSAVDLGIGHVSAPQELSIPFDQVLDWRIDGQTEPLRS